MSNSQKLLLGRILVSACLFITGYATGIIWFFLAAYVIVGYSTLIEAFMGIIHGQMLDENFLMTIASIGAVYCGEYPEAVAVMLFYQIGEFFEHYAVNNSRKSIADLMDIKAEYANKIVDGKEVTVTPDELAIGDLIRIKPGELIPVDGNITEGNSSLDTAALTGESMPREVSPGETVISGTVNLTGVLTVKVLKAYEDSTVAKVLDMVENATSRKAAVEKFITKFARYYTPIVVGLAVALAVIPPLAIKGAVFSDWLYRAMIFLVISCPCALVISVPLSLFAGVGSASRQGILVKGSNYLEALASVDTVAFDKTGTLTTGRFSVSEIYCAGSMEEDELLALTAKAESFSNHPIAASIVAKYKNSPYFDSSKFAADVSDYEEIAGKGVSCNITNKKIYCGNRRLMEDLGIKCGEKVNLGSVVYVADEKEYLGHVTVVDILRPESKETISKLKAFGVKKTIMLTGDRAEIAQSIGSEIGIDEICSQLLPGDKVDKIEETFADITKRKAKGHLVFVGDGINDAPVLARADVGIAMGAFGSDAAIEAADVVIMTDDISKLSTVIKIARKTLRIAKQNVVFALSIKLIILILGAIGLASMWLAVFADVGVAFLAILNSMRALRL